MRMIKTVFIDDGINENYININLHADLEVNHNTICERKNKDKNEVNHASDCASIFCHFAHNYELYSIKILNEHRRANKSDLITALEWCLNNDIDLINLSIGSTFYKDHDDIKKVIELLFLKGTIIIAACSNNSLKTYPASFPEVIGVKTDRTKMLKANEFVYIDNPFDGIDIIAYSSFSITVNDSLKEFIPYNSFATPYITSIVCNYICEHEHNNFAAVRQYLCQCSTFEKIITYEFLKSNMIEWKDIVDIPIIVFLYEAEKEGTNIDNLIKPVADFFEGEGYNSIACLENYNPVYRNRNIYSIDDIMNNTIDILSKIKLIFNTELPDLLMLGLTSKEINFIKDIHRENGVDIIVCFNCPDLFKNIKKTKDLCDKAFLIQPKAPNFVGKYFVKKYYTLQEYKKLSIQIKKYLTKK